MSTSTPVVFNFVSNTLRVVMRDGEPWFVAADVCAAISIGNTTDALRRLDDDEQALDSIEGISRGNDQANIINESGLYSLILGSRKPEAKKFKKWVTSEVLPAIRKTGRYVAPQAAPVFEQINNNDQRNLQRVIWMICDRFHWNSSWTFAVWFAIRQTIGCPAPNRFEVRHLPPIATELRRILEISTAVRDHCMELEKEAIRRIVRNREAAGPFVERLKAEEAGWLNEQRPWHAKLDGWHQQDLDALALRQPPGGSDHSDYAEPKVLQ